MIRLVKGETEKVVKADRAITDVNRVKIENKLLRDSLILPRLALRANALIGPKRGDMSIAPITTATLSRNRPT